MTGQLSCTYADKVDDANHTSFITASLFNVLCFEESEPKQSNILQYSCNKSIQKLYWVLHKCVHCIVSGTQDACTI